MNDKMGIAIINMSCFLVFLLTWYATSHERYDKELIEEIDLLRNRIEKLETKASDRQ